MVLTVKNKKRPCSVTRNFAEAIRLGDEYAFARYYEESLDKLVYLVRRIVRDDEEAKNIVHDTFVKLWQNREQIDPDRSLDSFVSTIAWNASINYLKRKKTHRKFFDEQMFTQNAEDFSAHEKLLAEETSRRIENVISEMPPQRRMVFELSRDEDLTYNEIAQRMGLSYNTVKNHMILALSKIRSVLSMLP